MVRYSKAVNWSNAAAASIWARAWRWHVRTHLYSASIQWTVSGEEGEMESKEGVLCTETRSSTHTIGTTTRVCLSMHANDFDVQRRLYSRKANAGQVCCRVACEYSKQQILLSWICCCQSWTKAYTRNRFVKQAVIGPIQSCIPAFFHLGRFELKLGLIVDSEAFLVKPYRCTGLE